MLCSRSRRSACQDRRPEIIKVKEVKKVEGVKRIKC